MWGPDFQMSAYGPSSWDSAVQVGLALKHGAMKR